MKLPAALVIAPLLLAACGGEKVYHHDERFAADGSHRREFAASKTRLCDAGRHALLEQGYLVTRRDEGSDDVLFGQKEFKEKDKRHAVLQVQAVCSEKGQGAELFITALESHYDVAQTKEKTAIGLPGVVPLSLSSSTTSEGQLKRSGETVDNKSFYEGFFKAVGRELAGK